MRTKIKEIRNNWEIFKDVLSINDINFCILSFFKKNKYLNRLFFHIKCKWRVLKFITFSKDRNSICCMYYDNFKDVFDKEIEYWNKKNGYSANGFYDDEPTYLNLRLSELWIIKNKNLKEKN